MDAREIMMASSIGPGNERAVIVVNITSVRSPRGYAVGLRCFVLIWAATNTMKVFLHEWFLEPAMPHGPRKDARCTTTISEVLLLAAHWCTVLL